MSLKELLKSKLEKVTPEKSDFDGGCEPSREYLPSIYLSNKELPEVKDWEVDGEYYIVLKVKQTSKSMRTVKDREVWHGDFDIKEIGVLEEKDIPNSHKDSDNKSIRKSYAG